MDSTIAYTCLLGLLLPLVLLYYNKGYLTANRYLAGFFFFASLYVLESFYFFYGESLSKIAFFTTTHAFFYLIGPCAFFYMRSILRDNSELSSKDYLHFALFTLTLIGYIPYFFTSWDNKLIVAQNLQSENWNMTPFHLNIIFSHKTDQVFNVLHTYFYSISLWSLLWQYKKTANKAIVQTKQYKLIRNWFLVFAVIFTVITINFTIAMANLWIYDDKSVFLNRGSVALIFASLVYIGMNMVIMFFPHIMYGLPVDLILKQTDSGETKTSKTSNPFFEESELITQNESKIIIFKSELDLFTSKYMETIEASLETTKDSKSYLNTDFKLLHISNESGIPAHHLTYFFNNIKKISFSDWRNGQRIAYAKNLIIQGETNTITLEALSIKSGFASQNTFIRAFKNNTGTTPSNYLKSLS